MLTSKQLNDMIVSFGKTTAAMREDMQTILINAAAHAYQHGDVTFFDRLFSNASGVNRKRAAKWVYDFGFATLTKDGKFKLNKDARNKADFKDGLECYNWLQANARAWYADEESMDDIAKSLDVAARLNALSKAIRAVTKGESKTHNEVSLDGHAINTALASLKAAILDHAAAPKPDAPAITQAAA
jgi:hypothetical protein